MKRRRQLARENGNANSVRLSVVHADAFGYMRQMTLNQRTFGVMVLDPPKLIIDRDDGLSREAQVL